MAVSHFLRPAQGDYAADYQYYIDLVPDGDILELFRRQIGDTIASLTPLSDAAADYRYAPDKWSIKEIVGHMIDTERVFAYRALCFARNESAVLPGFDQDAWAKAASFGRRPLKSLLAEMNLTRTMTLVFFENLTDEEWLRRGIANDRPFSVRALAYALAGHERHHLNILRTRYKVLPPNDDAREHASSFLQ
ncbi:MAG: DinB family protein [Ignavibacteriales bacterium]|nr:DinB family protein [Ignavibacteriales bacterium]